MPKSTKTKESRVQRAWGLQTEGGEIHVVRTTKPKKMLDGYTIVDPCCFKTRFLRRVKLVRVLITVVKK